MKGIQVVNRLKDILPKYTNDFSTIINASSLTRAGSTITCATATNHNLLTGNYVTIKGAKEPIALSTITFSNGIATATALTDHKLSDPSLFSPQILPIKIVPSLGAVSIGCHFILDPPAMASNGLHP
jgi:hypothetical protein